MYTENKRAHVVAILPNGRSLRGDLDHRLNLLSRELGSAYIVTLLVLFVLTALGLSLALITRTESQIGSQERIIQRTFHAADSGLELGVAQVFGGECQSRCIPMTEESDDPLFTVEGMEDQLDVTKSIGLTDQSAALSQLNDSDFARVAFFVGSEARRVVAGGGVPISRQTVAQRFTLDPWTPNLACFDGTHLPCPDGGTNTLGGGSDGGLADDATK